jgi:hypothetical protein
VIAGGGAVGRASRFFHLFLSSVSVKTARWLRVHRPSSYTPPKPRKGRAENGIMVVCLSNVLFVFFIGNKNRLPEILSGEGALLVTYAVAKPSCF